MNDVTFNPLLDYVFLDKKHRKECHGKKIFLM